MPYKLNGNTIEKGVAFTDSNGTRYPRNWIENASSSELAAVPTGGITYVAEPAFDGNFYTSQGQPKDLATLKAQYVQDQKHIANTLLKGTDWLVLRAAEGGTAVPSATTTYRAAVRTKSKEREDQVNACSSVDALAVLIQAATHIVGTASNGATEKKKEDGSSHDPKQWNNDAPNPDALKAWPTS